MEHLGTNLGAVVNGSNGTSSATATRSYSTVAQSKATSDGNPPQEQIARQYWG